MDPEVVFLYRWLQQTQLHMLQNQALPDCTQTYECLVFTDPISKENFEFTRTYTTYCVLGCPRYIPTLRLKLLVVTRNHQQLGGNFTEFRGAWESAPASQKCYMLHSLQKKKNHFQVIYCLSSFHLLEFHHTFWKIPSFCR